MRFRQRVREPVNSVARYMILCNTKNFNFVADLSIVSEKKKETKRSNGSKVVKRK